MRHPEEQPATAEYGIDDPPRVIALLFLGFTTIMAGIFIGAGFGSPLAGVPVWLVGLGFGGAAVGRIWTAKRTKGEVWDSILRHAALHGDEDALDVGCGRGLVLFKLAAALPDRAVDGIDIWSNRSLSGNFRAIAEANATVLDLGSRTTFHDADVRWLPFADASYDLVTAGFLFDGFADPSDRAAAAAEVLRVLRPGGRALVLDRRSADRTAAAFTAAGAHATTSSPVRATFPASRLVTVTAPD